MTNLFAQAVSGSPISSVDWNQNFLLTQQSISDLGAFIVSGLTPSAGAGLSVTVSAGTAVIGARITASGSFSIAGLANGTLNYLYLLDSGLGTSNTTGTAPSDSVRLGTATTAGGVVTAVNVLRSSGRQTLVRHENQVAGAVGSMGSISLAAWNATAGDGFQVYGTLPSGAMPALSLDSLSDVNLPSASQGDILYRNATEWVRLAAGTSGNFLKTQGAGANPTWAAVATSLSALSDVTLTSVAQGDMLYYNGSAWNNLAVGTSGQYLVTQGAGADPIWQTLPTTLAGDVTLAPAASARNVIQGTGTGVIPLTAKGFSAGQTADLANFLESGGVHGVKIDKDGNIITDYASGTYGQFGKITIGNNGMGAGEMGIICPTDTNLRLSAGTNRSVKIVGVSIDGQSTSTLIGFRGPSDITSNTSSETGAPVFLANGTISGPSLNVGVSGSNRTGCWRAGGQIEQWANSSTATNRQLTGIVPSFVVSTDASRTARVVFNVYDTAAREVMRFEASGSAPMLSTFGVAAVVQQANASQAAITAVTDANAKIALQAIYDLLKNYGLAPATA